MEDKKEKEFINIVINSITQFENISNFQMPVDMKELLADMIFQNVKREIEKKS